MFSSYRNVVVGTRFMSDPTGTRSGGSLPFAPPPKAGDDYMRKQDVEQFQRLIREQQIENENLRAKNERALGRVAKTATDKKELKPPLEPTWRSQVPVLRDFEFWEHQAARYPYMEKSDEHTSFFLRGVTCHPRLSDYPMCKDVISDYFACRENHQFAQFFNICAPLKEQMCACINLVFVKNHERMGRKLNSQVRDDVQEKRREGRLKAIADKAQREEDKRTKFVD